MDRRPQLLVTFHSQKGGVGKSVLAWHLAHALALGATENGLTSEQKRRVVLIDADVTGTSLADVLALEAVPPSQSAAEHLDAEKTRLATKDRYAGCFPTEGAPAVAFLNRILLCDPVEWERLLCAERFNADDHKHACASYNTLPVRLVHYLWRVAGVSELRVMPSSSHPGDVRDIAPHVFREDITDHFRHRFADLVLTLFGRNASTGSRRTKKHPEVRGRGFDAVIIDCPPGLHGMSTSVLECHAKMADPLHKRTRAPVRQVSVLVLGEDVQDVLAIFRTVEALPSGKESRGIGCYDPVSSDLLVVVNQYNEKETDGSTRLVRLGDKHYDFTADEDVRACFERLLRDRVSDTPEQLLHEPVFIPADAGLARTFKVDCPGNLPRWEHRDRLQQLIRRVLG